MRNFELVSRFYVYRFLSGQKINRTHTHKHTLAFGRYGCALILSVACERNTHLHSRGVAESEASGLTLRKLACVLKRLRVFS